MFMGAMRLMRLARSCGHLCLMWFALCNHLPLSARDDPQVEERAEKSLEGYIAVDKAGRVEYKACDMFA